MIIFADKNIDPVGINIDVQGDVSNLDVLFLWEDSFTNTILHSDLISINSGFIFYSGLNKPLSFFKNNIKFKVVSLTNHIVLFEYEFKNTSFLQGKKILYISQNNHSGYSYAARNYIYQLLENGFDVTWDTSRFGVQSYSPCNKYEQRVFDCLNKKIDYDCVIIHHVPDAWPDIVKTIQRGKRVYGLTVWETTKLHGDWVSYINNSVDEVIVPSYFNKDVFLNSGINKKINVWYHDIFPINSNVIDNINNITHKFLLYKNQSYIKDTDYIEQCIRGKTVYYNISQYNERKNIDQLIKVFCDKFTKNDNVCLLIKTFYKEFDRSQTEALKYKISLLIKNYTNPPSIFFCFDNLNDIQIQTIHYFSDVYFTLNRGEGFGLCTYTAKKFGNKVICGKFGAEIEYLDHNDVKLDYTLSNTFNMDVYHNWYVDKNQFWATYDDNYVISKLDHFPKRIK